MTKQSLPKRNKAKTQRSQSGNIGGPSTGHGMNYQIDYAIYETLGLISRALSAPHKHWEVRIEPRAISNLGITKWDIAIKPPEEFIEIKLNPQKQEILDWLRNVLEGATNATERKFTFVYNTGGGPLLHALWQLCRIATEAKGDAARFCEIVLNEKVKSANEILLLLGDSSHLLLQQIKLRNFPESVMDENIEMRARQLAGEAGGKRLRESIFHKFQKAIPHRKTFYISELIAEARKEGIYLQSPPEVKPEDLSPRAISALAIFQVCQAGIPLEVVAQAIRCQPSDLESELSSFTDLFTIEKELWSLRPLPSQFTPQEGAEIYSMALESLLGFIENHRDDKRLQTHVHNVIALIKECSVKYAETVAIVFKRLDKILKRLGNKHLVLKIAHHSVEAARRCQRNSKIVEAEAQALICGVAWVYQRVRKLDKARVAATESFELGKKILSGVNSAFCTKCIGRLCRMEAEELPPGNQRDSKLHESISRLEEAITMFSEMTEFGPTDPEVGDCYSLLGRTYLEAKQLNKASEAVRKAFVLITDKTSKDYLDLMILNGDLEAALGRRDAASSSYDSALELQHKEDPEISEMRARAYYKRGLNHIEMGNKELAIRDFRKGAEIWRSLGEMDAAAQAHWEEISHTEQLSRDSLQLLNEKSYPVRVAAMMLYKQRIAQTTGKALSQRAASPGREFWKQIVSEAEKQTAIEIIEW